MGVLQMTFLSRILAVSAFPFGLAISSAAWAQAVIVDEGPMIESDAIVQPVDPDANLTDGNSARVIVRERRRPAVYGWQGCGTYFYWNGERCVDARAKIGDR
jgi:hypothetical protein